MTQVSDTQEIPATEQVEPVELEKRRGVQIGIGWAAFFGVIALVLGLVGGIASHALFPAPAGAVGKQGPVGQAGPAGPAGTASAVDTSNLGYCFNVQYYTDNTGSSSFTWVSSVNLASPTLQSGTQSCPSGTFVPITAQSTP
jgi:hypothetical protein